MRTAEEIKLLSVQDIATATGLTSQGIRNRIRKTNCPYVTVGNLMAIKVADAIQNLGYPGDPPCSDP